MEQDPKPCSLPLPLDQLSTDVFSLIILQVHVHVVRRHNNSNLVCCGRHANLCDLLPRFTDPQTKRRDRPADWLAVDGPWARGPQELLRGAKVKDVNCDVDVILEVMET